MTCPAFPCPRGLDIDVVTGEISGVVGGQGESSTLVLVEELRPEGPVPVAEIWYDFLARMPHFTFAETFPLDSFHSTPILLEPLIGPGLYEIVQEPAGVESMGIVSTDLPPGIEFNEEFAQIRGVAEQLGTYRPLFTVFATRDGEPHPVAQLWFDFTVLQLTDA